MARAISRDGKTAVSAGCDGRVVVWDYPARKVIGKPLGDYDRKSTVFDPGLAISADGRRAAVASMTEYSEKGHLLSFTVFDLESREAILGPVDLGPTGVGLVEALTFSPDGSVLAIALSRGGGQIEKPTTEIQLWLVPAVK